MLNYYSLYAVITIYKFDELRFLDPLRLKCVLCGFLIFGRIPWKENAPPPRITQFRKIYFFNFPLYLQSVPVHSANVVKSCTKACRRVLTSTPLYLIGSESSCDLGSETYKTVPNHIQGDN
jgi:hypothetical protein